MTQTQEVRGVKTSIRTEQGDTFVNYRGTDVVTFDENRVILNTGGWWTVTTKTRMNQAANQFGLGFHVYQDKGEWFVDVQTSNKYGGDNYTRNLEFADSGSERLTFARHDAPRGYKIVRFRDSGTRRTIKRGLTLVEAREHCSRDDTRKEGVYFDGYDHDR